ncbi:MAG: amidohydrolase family protein [Pseudonocardiales bacterium]|nr:amidohydrolase family protein [Pseudonocardiales bacterium]
MTSELTNPLITAWIHDHEDELIATRRDLHAHPEVGHDEHRTTGIIVEHLKGLGLEPTIFPSGTGVLCDIGIGDNAIALRADIDALEIVDAKDVPYRSQNLGLCHACGHDVHTTALLGAASALVAAGDLAGRVRLIFQPAEEQNPGGALEAVEIGAVADVHSAFALHCDPRLEVGTIGLREGAITAACDSIVVRLSGPGGHTARPQLTADLVLALGKLIVETPALLSRKVDPRAGLSLIWAAVSAGSAMNAIPQNGLVRGTVRVLDREVWDSVGPLVSQLVRDIVAPTGAAVEVEYIQGVPPAINAASGVEVQRQAILATLGPTGVTATEQSMGGEDFAWMLIERPGSLARLGVRPVGFEGPPLDIHRGTFDIDEGAIAIGANFMAHTALAALASS